MAYITQNIPNSGLLTSLSNAFTGLQKSIDSYRAFKKTKSELESLTARDLHDLGICKADITNIAMQASMGTK